jgi:hypothetical protein
MSYVTSTIDTLYDAVIELSLRLISLYYKETSVALRPHFEVSQEEEETGENVPLTFRSVEDILKREIVTKPTVAKNTIMYARGISVPVYRNPTVEFDSQIGTIPYGEMVMMLEPRGRFFRVVWNTLQGWVLKEDLADRAAYVYPEFTIGQENSIDHANTAHVRAIIKDAFNTRHTELPLQAGEYVLYKLWKKGKRIEWPRHQDPRIPGLWHRILRGVPGVHIGVTPRVGDVMEYMLNSDIGHLAYVEAVFPDDTVTVSEANFPDSGIYNERVLTKEEWRELKPTFISVQ